MDSSSCFSYVLHGKQTSKTQVGSLVGKVLANIERSVAREGRGKKKKARGLQNQSNIFNMLFSNWQFCNIYSQQIWLPDSHWLPSGVFAWNPFEMVCQGFFFFHLSWSHHLVDRLEPVLIQWPSESLLNNSLGFPSPLLGKRNSIVWKETHTHFECQRHIF